MKKTAPEPKTLFDAAMKHAQERHAYRIRQLKLMQAKLAQLDEHMPAIKAAGLYLHGDDITLNYDKSLYIQRPTFGARNQPQLLDLLLARGFKEVGRKDHSSWFTVRVAKGHLRLEFWVDKPREPSVSAPAASAPISPAVVEAASEGH